MIDVALPQKKNKKKSKTNLHQTHCIAFYKRISHIINDVDAYASCNRLGILEEPKAEMMHAWMDIWHRHGHPNMHECHVTTHIKLSWCVRSVELRSPNSEVSIYIGGSMNYFKKNKMVGEESNCILYNKMLQFNFFVCGEI